ncbi:MAG: class I mannose-6-phosphate isomerase [Gemmatimonadota bacterium]
MTAAIPPVALVPVLLDKPWGGDALARWGLPVAPGARIGEAWMFADIAETSTGGAGGGAFHSPIANGPARTYSLRDAAHDWPGGLTGAGAAAEHPLLVKLLHAKEHLSVQVHPSPAYAAAHPGAKLKAESWYVLYAEPGAALFLGLMPGTTAADAVALAGEGRIADVLRRVPAVAGECHTLPSGLVHAMGAGVVIAEVQTASDTTFRLYDWAKEYRRAPRTLHLSEALGAMLPEAEARTVRAAVPAAGVREHRQVVADTAQYRLEQRYCAPGVATAVPPGAIVLAISGFGVMGDVAVTPSQAVFARGGASLMTPSNRSLTWLEATLADATFAS